MDPIRTNVYGSALDSHIKAELFTLHRTRRDANICLTSGEKFTAVVFFFFLAPFVYKYVFLCPGNFIVPSSSVWSFQIQEKKCV